MQLDPQTAYKGGLKKGFYMAERVLVGILVCNHNGKGKNNKKPQNEPKLYGNRTGLGRHLPV